MIAVQSTADRSASVMPIHSKTCERDQAAGLKKSITPRRQPGDAPDENTPAIAAHQLIIGIKGAGEMASGVAWRLFQSNFKRIFMMETPSPMAVRRQVCFCESVYDGTMTVEGVEAVRVDSPEAVPVAWEHGRIPVIVDPEWQSLRVLNPHVVIDAIIAKRNLGTNRSEAGLVIGLGPGFTAGTDVHAAIETNRGHNLGRVILQGSPEPNTGAPGTINGYTVERVLRAPCPGTFRSFLSIGAPVTCRDVVGYVDDEPVLACIDGVLRGQIRTNTRVSRGMKIGDIDPRGILAHCPAISEKARAIGGGVLEAILRKYNQ